VRCGAAALARETFSHLSAICHPERSVIFRFARDHASRKPALSAAEGDLCTHLQHHTRRGVPTVTAIQKSRVPPYLSIGIFRQPRSNQIPTQMTEARPKRDNFQSNPAPRYAYLMRPLRYSINVTLDGCCDHREMFADEDLHRHAAENLAQADALLFGRVTYEMMEAAWRPPAPTGARPDWMEPFARTIDAAKKYVVSSTLDRVDWNAELLRGDLGKAVQQLKRESGKGLFVGGVKLPLALAELGLIDEYEFVVHPRIAGHGPTLFAGLSKRIDLRLLSRLEFGSGAVAMRYEPRR